MSEMRIGEIIRTLRQAAGVKQRDLAEGSYTSQSLISRIESGRVTPRFDDIIIILEALNARLEVNAPGLQVGVTIRDALVGTPA